MTAVLCSVLLLFCLCCPGSPSSLQHTETIQNNDDCVGGLDTPQVMHPARRMQQNAREQANYGRSGKEVRILLGKDDSATTGDLRFQPSHITFNSTSVAHPMVKTFEIVNLSTDKEIHVRSATTDVPFIHASIGKGAVLSRHGGNCTVTVIFLPRSVGNIQEELIISTSTGTFSMLMSGRATHNPYHIPPLIFAKIVPHMSYLPGVQIFNPHAFDLWISEVYTSGGFLQVALPSEMQITGGRKMWRVPPYQRRKIMDISFVAETAGKYKGYISFYLQTEVNYIISVEAEVEEIGLHSIPATIDFGTITSPFGTAEAELSILNTNAHRVEIVSASLGESADHQVSIHLENSSIESNSIGVVAKVKHQAIREGAFKGKFIIRTSEDTPANSRVEVPYKAKVVYGQLEHRASDFQFRLSSEVEQVLHRQLRLTNKFRMPLQFYCGEIDDPAFVVNSFQEGVILGPGQSANVLNITFNRATIPQTRQARLTLWTNVTTFQISLNCYHGNLTFSVSREAVVSKLVQPGTSDNHMDFGLIGVNDINVMMFNVTNMNPLAVPVHSVLHRNVRIALLELESVWNAKGYAVASGHQYAHPRLRPDLPLADDFIVLEPYHTAIFSVTVSAEDEEEVNGEFIFVTPYQELRIPLMYKSLRGGLTFWPSDLHFGSTFPGRTVYKDLFVRSSYKHPVVLHQIVSSDARFKAMRANLTVEPNKRMLLATVAFNASNVSPADNYLTEVSLAPLVRLGSMDEPLAKRDLVIYKRREEIWRRLSDSGELDISAVISVVSDLTSYNINVRAQLDWPVLVKSNKVEFGLCQKGQTHTKYLDAINPSDSPLRVELISLPLQTGGNVFSVSGTNDLLKWTIPPQSSERVGPVEFNPTELTTSNATLYLRNNITILYPIQLTGTGGTGLFRWRNTTHILSKLYFDTSEEDWIDCGIRRSASAGVHRSFYVTNSGNLAINVTSISTQNECCGVSIFEFDAVVPFVLEAGQTIVIRIVLVPDFYSSIIDHTIVVESSMGTLLTPITAVIPFDVLHKCVHSHPISPLEDDIRLVIVLCVVAAFGISILLVVRLLITPHPQPALKLRVKRIVDSDWEPVSRSGDQPSATVTVSSKKSAITSPSLPKRKKKQRNRKQRHDAESRGEPAQRLRKGVPSPVTTRHAVPGAEESRQDTPEEDSPRSETESPLPSRLTKLEERAMTGKEYEGHDTRMTNESTSNREGKLEVDEETDSVVDDDEAVNSLGKRPQPFCNDDQLHNAHRTFGLSSPSSTDSDREEDGLHGEDDKQHRAGNMSEEQEMEDKQLDSSTEEDGEEEWKRSVQDSNDEGLSGFDPTIRSPSSSFDDTWWHNSRSMPHSHHRGIAAVPAPYPGMTPASSLGPRHSEQPSLVDARGRNRLHDRLVSDNMTALFSAFAPRRDARAEQGNDQQPAYHLF